MRGRLTLTRRMTARARLKELPFAMPSLLLTGQILFTSGWSLVWAISLKLTPLVPYGLALSMMAAGLSLPALNHFLASGRHRSGETLKVDRPGTAEVKNGSGA